MNQLKREASRPVVGHRPTLLFRSTNPEGRSASDLAPGFHSSCPLSKPRELLGGIALRIHRRVCLLDEAVRTDQVGDPFCILIRWRLSGPVCETDLVIDVGKERKREVVFLRERRLRVDRVEAAPENFGTE